MVFGPVAGVDMVAVEERLDVLADLAAERAALRELVAS